jgi:hypothetical protein
VQHGELRIEGLGLDDLDDAAVDRAMTITSSWGTAPSSAGTPPTIWYSSTA